MDLRVLDEDKVELRRLSAGSPNPFGEGPDPRNPLPWGSLKVYLIRKIECLIQDRKYGLGEPPPPPPGREWGRPRQQTAASSSSTKEGTDVTSPAAPQSMDSTQPAITAAAPTQQQDQSKTMGSMAEEVSEASVAPQVEVAEPEQLNEWTEEGTKMLDRYKLREAERLFHQVITHTDEKVKDRDKNVIKALVGLSEVYSKRARSMRKNELEWHRMYMHAISSKRKALEYCGNGMRLASDNDDDEHWYRTQEHKARANLNLLQDCLIRSLQDRIMENKSGQTPMEKMMGIKRPKPKTEFEESNKKGPGKQAVDIEWLETFQKYVKEKYATFLLPDEIEEPIVTGEPQLKRSESIESLQEVKPPRKKINFDKVQEAIQNLVKQITTDMRHRQIHKDMTPEDKLTLMSPLADNFDLLGTFREAMYSEERIEEETEEDIKKDDASSSSGTVHSDDVREEVTRKSPSVPRDEAQSDNTELLLAAANWRNSQDTLSQYRTSAGSSSSTSQGTRSLGGAVSAADGQKQRTVSSRASYRSPTPTRSLFRSQRRPSLEDEEDVLRDVGVLRVWRGYRRENSPDNVLNNQSSYKLESYEELSPLTEVAGRSWDAQRPQKVRSSVEREVDDLSAAPDAPITESELNLTLGYALTHMADRLRKHKDMKEAQDLYIFSLGIFQKINKEVVPGPQASTDSNEVRPHIAHIMQSLGSIKCDQGDFVGGSQLMEECINIYGMKKDREADLSVANTWYELGSAFMAEQWKESPLYDYIMRSVKEIMEKEVKRDAEEAEIGGDVEADSDDDDESEGDAYWVSTQEAIGCFNHALDILRRHADESSEPNNHLYVDVLTKLGDCNIMTGNYEQAIKCYEEALYMFKSIIGSTTLPNNAHVLAMLGTTNFLCGNFSKAASMFECAHMLQQHIYGFDDATFEMAFTLSMMGLTFYSMKRYHRSIAWCLKAFELYTLLYKEDIVNIKSLHRWFVTESLYIVGYSYSTLSFHEKALYYLGIAKCMVKNGDDVDVKQCVKILKAIADEYSILDDNEHALALYNEALEMSQALGNESSAAALQNQLLNRMAGVHVNTKEYSTAALYLQQALDYQKNVENSIKDDLVGILRQLGLTYTLSGDVDRAIECYNDCLDAYQEAPSSKREDMAQLMGTLGTLYHVKACIQEDNDDMENLLTKAERFYQDAMNIDSGSSVCVQYANYLYQQAQAGDALLAMLPVVHSPSAQERDEPSVTYNGVEHAVLPEHLQQEIDDLDEVTLETRVFSKFLAILCYKQLKLDKDAEDCLVELFKAVCNSDVALNHSILGYAMLEMSLYPEAAECFANAAALQHDNDLAITNYWISLCLWSYGTMTSSIRNIFSDALREAEDEWMIENKLREAVRLANQKGSAPVGVRDSGYYDHTLETSEDQTDEAWAPVEEMTYMTDHLTEADIHSNKHRDPRARVQMLMERHRQQESSAAATGTSQRYVSDGDDAFMDRGYTSNECLVDRQQSSSAEQGDKRESARIAYDNKGQENIPEAVTWETEECETPVVLLEMLRQQKELLNREYKVHFDVGIIGEEDEEDSSKPPVANTNSTFANMVETPQSVLHELERKMVEEQRALEEVAQTLEKEGFSTTEESLTEPMSDDPPSESQDEWVTTEEVVYHEPSKGSINQQKKREHSPEQDVYGGQWAARAEVASHDGRSMTSTHSSKRHITPMEVSPENESRPESTNWRSQRVTQSTATPHSMSSADQQHVIDSIHNWDNEGNRLNSHHQHQQQQHQLQRQKYEHVRGQQGEQLQRQEMQLKQHEEQEFQRKQKHEEHLRQKREEQLRREEEERLKRETEKQLRQQREEQLRYQREEQRLRQEEELRKQQQEHLRRQEEQQLRQKEEQVRYQREEQMRQQQEEQLRRQQQEQMSRQEEQQRRRQQREIRRQEEEQRRRQQEEQRKRQEEERVRRWQEEQKRRQEEEQIRRQKDEQRRQQREERLKRQKEEQLKRQQEEQMRRQQEVQLRQQAEEQMRQQKEEQLRRQQEEQMRQQREEQLRRQQEEQMRQQRAEQLRRQQEEQMRQQKEEQLRRQQEEKMRRQREEQLRRQQEEQMRRQKEEQLRRQQEEQMRQQKEEHLRRQQEEKMRRQKEEQLRQQQEEQIRRQKEEQLRQQQEERMRQQREEQMRQQQEEQMRRQRDEQLRRQQEEQMRRQKEEQLRRQQEEQMRRQREEQLRQQQEEQMRQQQKEQLQQQQREQLQRQQQRQLQQQHQQHPYQEHHGGGTDYGRTYSTSTSLQSQQQGSLEVGGNNNYESHHQINGDRARSSSNSYQRSDAWNAGDTQRISSRAERMAMWRSQKVAAERVTLRPAEVDTSGHVETSASQGRWSDGRNGNDWRSAEQSLYSAATARTTSAIHEAYTPHQEKKEGESWTTIEETIETPPELLAYLRAQQQTQ